MSPARAAEVMWARGDGAVDGALARMNPTISAEVLWTREYGEIIPALNRMAPQLAAEILWENDTQFMGKRIRLARASAANAPA